MLEIKKKQLHDLIDSLPEDKLPSAYDFFLNILDEETEDLTEEDEKDIDEALSEYERGEYYTFEEVFGDDK